MMILDVACGANPHGDVNLDIGPDVLASDSGPRTRADVYGSVYSLPFKDNSFAVVHFVGLLHHLTEPERAWKEIVRVASDAVIGEEPSVVNPGAHMDRYHVKHGFVPRELVRICSVGVAHLRIGLYVSSLPRFPWRVNWHILALKRHPTWT